MKPRTDIHIGLFIASLEGGGAEKMLVNLSNALAQKKARVTLYLVNKKGPFLDELEGQVQLVDLKAKYGVKSVFFELRKILKKSQPDVMISTQPHINVVLGLAGMGLTMKPILIFREANTPSIKYSNYGFLSRWIYKKGYSTADHYVAVSEGVKQDMLGYYNIDSSKVIRIYNPLIDSSIKQKAAIQVDHPWIQKGYPVIMAMGRLVPQKDHLTLIQAFSLLKKSTDAKLLILGDTEQDPTYTGQVRNQIKQLHLKDSVELAGFQANPFKFLSKASLFVLSSRFEGLPGALVQAMACGCPVVSTDCPSGPDEILGGGKYGKLVPVGDAEKLAQAMKDSLSTTHNPDLIKSRAEEFSVEKSAQEYLSFIQNLIISRQKKINTN